MIKLMKLEIAKMGIGWYVKGAVIANIVIVMLLFVICYVEKTEGNLEISNMADFQIVLGSLVRATFIVMAAVLIVQLIINEYKNKTIFVMFMYPVSRKKLFASKLMLVFILTFVTIVVSHIFTLTAFMAINYFVQVIEGTLVISNYAAQLASITAFAFAAAGTSLIPLYFGMRKYSVTATIVWSLLIVALTSSHNPVFSLASIIYIPLGLAVIGLSIAWLTIRDIDKVDVL